MDDISRFKNNDVFSKMNLREEGNYLFFSVESLARQGLHILNELYNPFELSVKELTLKIFLWR